MPSPRPIAPGAPLIGRRVAVPLPSGSILQPARDASIAAAAQVIHKHIKATEELEDHDSPVAVSSFLPSSSSSRSFFSSSPPSHFLHRDSLSVEFEAMAPAEQLSVPISARPSDSPPDSPSSSSSPLLARASSRHFQASFDIDNFLPRQFTVAQPLFATAANYWNAYYQKPIENILPVPSVYDIVRYMKRLFDHASLTPECAIIGLIYVERLLAAANIRISHRNWIPIVTAALLAASKMWDDHCSFNGEFADILPFFSLSHINSLERLFLASLSYELYISPSDYARYYFGLRAVRSAGNDRNDSSKNYGAVGDSDPLKASGANDGPRPERNQLPRYYMSIGIGVPQAAKRDLREEEEILLCSELAADAAADNEENGGAVNNFA